MMQCSETTYVNQVFKETGPERETDLSKATQQDNDKAAMKIRS